MNEKTFQIYPNPANQQLTIATEMSGQVDIMGINGVLHKTLKVSEALQNISIADLSKGIYWVRFTSNDQTKIRKLVVN
ncbi:MAG: T9SS type A sorting domain-containing protein [Saprospiraceae bacterium]|nr:T9SS type A sorting domain-containing protein [Saprospiraceae bacterium]